MTRSRYKPLTIPTGVQSPTALAKVLGVSRQRAHQILNREKHRARNTVAKALKRGVITKPLVCERCGGNDLSLEAHHPDYSQPLLVNWLCLACHLVVHPHPYRATSKPVCRRCGNDIDHHTNRRNWKRLCGDCAIRLHDSYVVQPCGWCGIVARRPRTQLKKNKSGLIFCDGHCRAKWGMQLRLERMEAAGEGHWNMTRQAQGDGG